MKVNYKHMNIIVALFFAAIMLVTGFIMKGHEDKSTVIMLVMALWFVPFNYLNKKLKENSCS